MRVEQAGDLFARHVGPFLAWGSFYGEVLKAPLEDTVRSHVLWVLANVYMLAGLSDRALAMAQAKKELDLQRGAEREAAIAGVLTMDILRKRGQLEEVLRILQQELLPIFKKIGDSHSLTIALGKIADILEDRGQLDEALKNQTARRVTSL